MDSSKEPQKYSFILRQYRAPLVLGLCGLMFLGYGMIQYLSPGKGNSAGVGSDKTDVVFEAASSSNPSASSGQGADGADAAGSKKRDEEKFIVVDVEGAVLKPGVYTLPADSRVQDALKAAQGYGKDADSEKVAKGLNLAAKLRDGVKIYIPYQGEALIAGGDDDKMPELILGVESSHVLNINSASESELDVLPGIGKITAGKIISNRPYQSVNELLEKKVVGGKVFEDIKDKVRVE